MTDQQTITESTRHQVKRTKSWSPNYVARSVRKWMDECEEIYQLDVETRDALRESGCPHLVRDEAKSLAMVREVFIKNSRAYGQRKEDGRFYSKFRLRNLHKTDKE